MYGGAIAGRPAIGRHAGCPVVGVSLVPLSEADAFIHHNAAQLSVASTCVGSCADSRCETSVGKGDEV